MARFFRVLILLSLLSLLMASAASAQEEQYVVTAASVRVHQGPGTEYPLVVVLNQGDEVTLLGSQAGWYRIRTQAGENGWVPSRSIKPAAMAQPLQNKPKKQAAEQKKKKQEERRAKRAARPGPRLALTPKVGIAMPFLAAMTPAVELDFWGRLVRADKTDVYFTTALGYSYMEINSAFGGSPDLQGHWAPLNLGMAATLKQWADFTPYAGAGLGLNYYDFEVNEKDTDLDLDDETVHGLGVGGYGTVGVWVHLGFGTVVIEDQLHIGRVDNGNATSNIVFVGYRFSW